MTKSLHYVKRGSGIPVLFLHGLSLDHRSLLPLDSVFEQGYERWYLDLPGMGESSAYEGITGAPSVYDSVERFVSDHFHERKFLIVGESFGGMLARLLATLQHEKVLGICLLCPVIIPEHEKRTLPAVGTLKVDSSFMATLSTEDREVFLLNAVFADREHFLVFKDSILPGLKSSNPKTLDTISGSYTLELDSAAMSHTGPALMLLGRQDITVGYHDHLSIIDNYPNMTVVLMSGAGHNILLDKLPEAREEVKNWLGML